MTLELMKFTRPELLDDLRLEAGSHCGFDRDGIGMVPTCFMEAFSLMTGQQMTDAPRGAERTVRTVMIHLNDATCGDVTPATRAQLLKPMFAEVLNTAPSDSADYTSPRAQRLYDAFMMEHGASPRPPSLAAFLVLARRLCAAAKQDMAEGKLSSAMQVVYYDMTVQMSAEYFKPVKWITLADFVAPQQPLTLSLTVAPVPTLVSV